jgi:hypothetical protein
MEAHEIVMRSLQADPEVDYKKELPAIVAFSGRPNVDTVQIGNTVFIGQRGKGDDSDKIFTFAYSQDTGRAAFKSSVNYLNYLQGKGITRMACHLSLPYQRIFDMLQQYFEGTDTVVGVVDRGEEDGAGYVNIGEEPIRKV